MQLDTNMDALSGATQVPLLSRDQLMVGAILTGEAWATIRRVERIEGTTIYLQRLPPTGPPDHAHAFSQHGNTECACGLMRQPLAELLPVHATTPRTHLLTPAGGLVVPNLYTLYGLQEGATLRIITMQSDRQWAQGSTGGLMSRRRLPIVPRLAVLWTIPERLQEILATAPQPNLGPGMVAEGVFDPAAVVPPTEPARDEDD